MTGKRVAIYLDVVEVSNMSYEEMYSCYLRRMIEVVNDREKGIFKYYINADTESKKSNINDKLISLVKDAEKREIDEVGVWIFSNITYSPHELIKIVDRLELLKVNLVLANDQSLNDQYFGTEKEFVEGACRHMTIWR